MENRETKDIVLLDGLTMVAERDEDIDISDLPSFSAHKMCVRIVEFDTHLLGTMFALANVIDHEDGTYSTSKEFPLSMVSGTIHELLSELNALDDECVCWGLPAVTLKQAAQKDVLTGGKNGYLK